MHDSTERYFLEVSALPIPTSAEEAQNFQQYAVLRAQSAIAATQQQRNAIQQDMIRLRGRIARGYLRYVIGEARKRTRDSALLPDLISAGNEGLLCAIDHFDPSREIRFLTFAFHWVRVKINNVLYKLDSVHVSVHRRRKENKAGTPTSRPAFVPLDDVELASSANTHEDVTLKGARAMRYLTAAELPLRERLVVTYALGLRTPVRSYEEIALILYTLDRSLLPPSEVESLFKAGMRRLREWVTLCGAASVRDELSEEPSLL